MATALVTAFNAPSGAGPPAHEWVVLPDEKKTADFDPWSDSALHQNMGLQTAMCVTINQGIPRECLLPDTADPVLSQEMAGDTVQISRTMGGKPGGTLAQASWSSVTAPKLAS